MNHSDIEALQFFMAYMVLLCFLSGFLGLYVAMVAQSMYRWVNRRYIFFPAATRWFQRRAAARRELAIRVRDSN